MTAGVAARLAHALGRKDEEPNLALADALVREADTHGIAALADIVRGGSRAARHDAIKVLYEIGARQPGLLRPHAPLFLAQMSSADNRMIWGALTALAALSQSNPELVAPHLDAILSAADAGSVIARDQAVLILIALARRPGLRQAAIGHLFNRLRSVAVNQLPMAAERIAAALDCTEHAEFRQILTRRLSEDLPASKRRRLEKVMAKLG